MRCADCKFAEWERAASGRLSPKGQGRCTWLKVVRVAASAYGATTVTFKGGTIWRKDGPDVPCPVFERAE